MLENLTGEGHRGEFADAGAAVGLPPGQRTNGRGLAAADYDNDGDLDIAINSVGGRLILLRSSGASGHWLEVKLSRFSPGTTVTALLPGGRRLVREVHAGSSYLSSEDPRLHFGLGAATKVRELVVRFPDGSERRLANVAADQILVADAVESRHAGRPSSPTTRSTSSPAWSVASARAGGSCSTARHARAQRLRDGELPDFLPETKDVRDGDWRVEPVPEELQDRRVEITGPVDRKMVINALNSGAKMFMADFEDSNSPTWRNCIEGQVNLTDALERTITLDYRGEAVLPERRDRDAARAAARLASRGAALPGRRGADLGEPLRLRPLLLPQPRARRHLVLPAEARVASRGAALERRLRLGAGRARRARRGRSRRPS